MNGEIVKIKNGNEKIKEKMSNSFLKNRQTRLEKHLSKRCFRIRKKTTKRIKKKPEVVKVFSTRRMKKKWLKRVLMF